MKRILSTFRKKDWFAIFVGFGLIVAQVWLDLKSPDYMKEITNLLQTGGSTQEILNNGLIMLACTLGSMILSFATGYLVARVACNCGMRLREMLYDQVGLFSKEDIHRFSTSSLITRCTNDTQQVQSFIAMGLQIIIKAPVLCIWAICKIVTKSWQWSTATAVAVVVLISVILFLVLLCLPKFKKIQKQIDRLNTVTRETLTGVRVIHAFNAEKYQQEKAQKVNEDLTKTQLFTSKALSVLSPFMSFLIGALSLAIYWIGAKIISDASMMERMGLFSDMVVFSTYAMQIISAFVMMILIFMMLPRVVISTRRINEVLSLKPSIRDGKGAKGQEEGTVEFKNVDFCYEDGEEKVLSNISFKINKGETFAIIGATGSGKSTLIDLIPRFMDATNGEVLVDGVNVKEYRLSELYDKIGYASQKAMIFSGTVTDNVTMGHDISLDDVLKALDQSKSSEFVEKMDEKENSKIVQGGKNISGGQKQRLSIARAIASKPEIMIFDDSFSALDYKTDKNLRQTLNDELANTTRIIVGQRVGTIKNADKILVLDNGKIAGLDTHENLLKNNKVYQEIVLSQLSKEEI